MTTKADTSVKWFHSGMIDAPVLSGQAGKLIELLDACLINGFSVRTPDSIVVADGVATVSISAGNPYEKHAVVVISGASDAALNAEWRTATSGASSFTFACPGVANGTVTGASVKRAGAGWGKPFSDTNKAAYQSLDPASTQLYLRVDDSFGRYAQLRGYEHMTGIDAGTGLFPTVALVAAGLSWAKSNEANANAKTWAFFADGSMLYIYQATYGTTNPTLGAFGDLVSFVPGDRYHCVLAGSAVSTNTSSPGNQAALLIPSSPAGCYVARAGNQITLSTGWNRTGVSYQHAGPRVLGNNVVAPLGGEILLRTPIFATDGASQNTAIRGYLPGLIEPLHAAFTGTATVPFDGEGALLGRLIAGYSAGDSNNYGSFAMDLTGPWR